MIIIFELFARIRKCFVINLYTFEDTHTILQSDPLTLFLGKNHHPDRFEEILRTI